ncbi:MAG: LysR family transcriptional regulator [Chloroflexi bacterium]|nr:LysR family transcriptional regulator [Chloroflexota bacterium]
MFHMVELREVRVFLVLAEELHYGRTADRLGLTASRVSQIVRLFEAHVGGQLFERSSRHVELTPLGRRLRDGAWPGYEQLERAFYESRETAAGTVGTLRVGLYTSALTGPHWARICETFTSRNPRCLLELIDTSLRRSYIDWLRNHDVDLLVLRLPISDPDISIGPVLSREPRVLLVSDRHSFARRQSVSYEELADYELSDVPEFPREMMNAFIPPTTPSGKTLRRIKYRSLDELMMRVAAGSQVHPSVVSVLEHNRLPGIVAVPIRDLPDSETALAWLSADRSLKLREFVRAAEDVLGGSRGYQARAVPE